MKVDGTRFNMSDLGSLGSRLIADLNDEAERRGTTACPCVYCSYWAEDDKCALKRVMAFLRDGVGERDG